MKLAIAVCLSACLAAQAPYATRIEPADAPNTLPINRGSVALWQSLTKLHTRASLIMITAHPDDEDGGMLTYESRGQGARVALLTLNRGEGGANVMSADYFDALGLVRTMELLAAGRYYGVEQYWTRLIDYGYSKTKAESIQKWTHDRVLYDVVRVVRMVRPLVVTSVFVGGPSDGHGNHQTAGGMAREVFEAAGDPSVFPDQIAAGLLPWKPIKSYARVPFGHDAADFPANVTVAAGAYDPVLGLSHEQVAREGLALQKSQNGGGSIPDAGDVKKPYHRFASRVPTNDVEQTFFDGIDTSLAGIASLAGDARTGFLDEDLKEINAAVEEAIAGFSAAEPQKIAPALATGLKQTLALLDRLEKSGLSNEAKYNIAHELEIKHAQFNSALAEALGLSLSAKVAQDIFRAAIPGQTFPVKVHVVNPSPVPVQLESIGVEPYLQTEAWRIAPSEAVLPRQIVNNQPVDASFTVTVPADAAATRPYFSRPDIERTYYDIQDEHFLHRSLPPYPLAASATFRFQGVPIHLLKYVQTVKQVTGAGTVLEPLIVAPALSVAISPRAGVVPLSAKSFPVTVVIHSNVKAAAEASVALRLPDGWTAKPNAARIALAGDGAEQSVEFAVVPKSLEERPYQIKAVASLDGKEYDDGYQVTGYAGLRPYPLYRPAIYKLSGVDLKVAPGLKICYIMGSGDDIPASLQQLGINVTLLSAAEIAGGDLTKYDVILLGVRTYAARPELSTYNSRILDYVKGGGVVIVQYNTPEFDHNYGPYPFEMTANPEEVTDEESKVEILAPANPVFTWPNKISAKDFDGWVEERGSKWMRTWDPRYQALLETHDQDQPPQKGGLLYARYGKGLYIYNAYAFYRQLPEGVPGAYRLFANLISLPKNPNR